MFGLHFHLQSIIAQFFELLSLSAPQDNCMETPIARGQCQPGTTVTGRKGGGESYGGHVMQQSP
jgi:hypothetical protein